MPKQLYKINQFHGGLNSNSDARDIADNELSEATDIMVDELGKIRLLGRGNGSHTEVPDNTATIDPGFGLFQFSHDRKGAHLAVEHLSNTGDFSSNWTGGNGWTLDSTDVSYAHEAWPGNLVQTAAERAVEGMANTKYAFTYTISGFAETILTFEILGTGNQFAAANTALEQSDGTHTTTFMSHDTDPDQPFTINVVSSTSGAFNIDNVSLYIVDEEGDDYLAMADTSSAANIDIYSRAADVWGTGMIDLGSVAGMKACFYTVDGALRVCDGDFENSNTSKWYGYVDTRHFENPGATAEYPALTPGGSADTYNRWHVANAEVAPPTRGIAGYLYEGSATGDSTTSLTEANVFQAAWENEIVGHIVLNETDAETIAITSYTDADTVGTETAASDLTGNRFTLFPPAGTGFNLSIGTAGSSGSIPAGTYEFATTFIYDKEPGDLSGGGQESVLYICPGTVAITANQYIVVSPHLTAPYNARLTGGKVYLREQNSDNTWTHLLDISLKYGTRQFSNQNWDYWLHRVSANNATTLCIFASTFIYNLVSITYEQNSGISQDATSSTAKYKTAVVANRIAYIGNVQYDGTIYGDAVFKSPVNKFDIFSSDRRLEASINDGDSIVKLESYADRLLIFKKNKLELLNISQEIEFLEDTFMYKGVSHPAATCKTDFGIAWVNKQGCYLYDGQKVSNLLEKQGRQIIKESDWATFTTNEPMLGYIPKKRQLLIVDDNTATGTGKIFIYDMVTQSWIKGSDLTIPSSTLTNFVTDWNNDLIYAYSAAGSMVWWDDSSYSSSLVDIKTKDIDFGQPGQVKRIYKFYITHRGDASNIQLSYAINGDQDATFPTEAGSELPVTSAVTDWVTTAITPTTFSCYSVRLRLFSDGQTPANFEINDISIVFRLKGER